MAICYDFLFHYYTNPNNNRKQNQSVLETIKGENLILLLLEKNNGMQPGEICSIMSISTARIAAALNNLEEKGLVYRELDKNDRRRICVFLTDKGKTAVYEKKERTFSFYKKMFEQLGEQDANDYVRITKKIAQIYTKDKEL
jgi:DNA-binding MarR family transcriptional regulator